MICTISRKIAALVTSGLGLAVFGLCVYLIFPIIMDDQIKKKLILSENSESYKFWKNVPVPIYLHFYFFNLTNHEEVWHLTSKPILEQVGPYTFREEREKVNISWNSDGTVTYKEVKRWHFQPDRTEGSLDDIITTLNVPMVAAATKGKQMNEDFVFLALDEIFTQLNCSWFVFKPVRQLLFEGYEDPLMKIAKAFMNLPYDKFGWFYERNNTDDGIVVADTGASNINSLDGILTWNALNHTNAYDAPCNKLTGSAGDMWPPKRTRNDEITLFVKDICRSLTFQYLTDIEMSGVKAFRYWSDNTELDNGKYNPENKCYCSDDVCLPAGAINVSSCKFDAPAVVSYPHFLFADPIYSQGVIGMEPDPKEHRMYLDIVPEMGIPIGVAARMQINIIFESIQNISQFENITNRIYFPILWFSETADAGEDILSQMRLVTVTLPRIANISAFVMVAIGSFFMLTALVLAILYSLQKIQDQPRTLSSQILTEGQKPGKRE